MTPEQINVWTKEIRDRARAENRAFNKFHKANRYLDREQARRAWDAGRDFGWADATKTFTNIV